MASTWLCGSTMASAPMGLSHRSRSEAAFCAPLGPADPWTALPPWFFMSVTPWPYTVVDSASPASRVRASAFREMLIKGVPPWGVTGRDSPLAGELPSSARFAPRRGPSVGRSDHLVDQPQLLDRHRREDVRVEVGQSEAPVQR